MRFDQVSDERHAYVERQHSLWEILKRHALRVYGFPRSPEQRNREIAAGWTGSTLADMGALRNAHIRDCLVMARYTSNSRNDWLPQVSVEMDMED